MTKIRIVVADDHAILRSGLRLLLNSQPDLEVVGEAGSADDVRRVCEALQPDVVTLDWSMPGGTAVRNIEALLQSCPRTKILVLTMHDDPAYMRAALAAGAHGYVVKKGADVELLTAVRALAAGRSHLNVDLSRSRRPADPPSRRPSSPLASLSERELEVFKLLALGHTNAEIGERLLLSVKTVESYRAKIMAKLRCSTRAELTRCALEAGLLDPE